MAILRIFLIYSLVLVMLPLGSYAGAVTAKMQPITINSMADLAEPSIKATVTSKRCRTAVLPGLVCNAETVIQTGAQPAGDLAMLGPIVFDAVVLPVGVTATGHRDPPRQG